MKKQMVDCEDGRRRQARVYGIPREDGDYVIMQAGVRVRGRHVTGETWYNRKTGTWIFLTNPEGRNPFLLPRVSERPKEPKGDLLLSPSIRTR